MKYIYKISIVIITFLLLVSYTNKTNGTIRQTNPFVGTWKYQDGNEVFMVTFWEDPTDMTILLGHYKKIMVDTNGFQTSVIYNSNHELFNSGTNWPFVLSGGFNVNTGVGGTIHDNTIQNLHEEFNTFYPGSFELTLINTCLGCPLRATWTVSKDQGVVSGNEPDEFSVPNNVVLTQAEL